jgi:hypothetical protein
VRPARCLTLSLASALAIGAAACATAMSFQVPDGPWLPDQSAPDAFAAASASCRSVKTITAEIGVSGRAGASRIRGRIIVGLARGGSLRLEAPAPFGAPVFILAARANRATLWLPRDHRVVRDAAVEDVLDAITGLRRSGDDLLALVSGCLADGIGPVGGGRRNPRGWVTIDLPDRMSAFLHREAAVWRIAGGQRAAAGETGSWSVSYADFVSGFPGTIGIRQQGAAAAGQEAATVLTLRPSQVETNVTIDPAAFDVAVPADAAALTIDELRRAGPLAERDAGDGSRR